MNSVNVKREKQVIPTYVPRKPIELPMFFEHKPYQGASGRLYPLPFSDSISDEKKDVEYDIFTLQNEYIMTQVAPELGGKILRGYDKTGAYDFIYYNEVVKPALVGLAGPWISGGIEFNYPQHHRPTTYMQLEAYAEEGADGSKTVWVGEVEPFNRMKGMAGITVDTGRSYIKAKIRVYNRTEQPQVFMWWANLAVPVNETYKTIFPPDVEWVNDHDRRCVMSWPIAKGVYQTARPFDYGEGTDISMYDAIRVPSSFLVSQGQSDQDFVAGYDGGKQKGIVTVADHHIAPGKKMWHWGKGDFGDMWCSNLTDENGPYIELMTGVYTDNQPDFTWIAPYETKEFEQYWYPIHDIGDVKNATIDAAVNVEKRGSNLFLGFNVTGTFKNAVVTVCQKGTCFFTETVDLTPDKAYLKELTSKMVENRECLEEQTMEMAPDMQLDKIAVNVLTPDWKLEDITVSLTAEDGTVLVDYETYIRGQKEPITPRKPVKRPCEIESVEELYINGLHLEQYKQHNYSAADYYKEGLQRDPADTRCNTAMARLAFRNGNFAECISYADKAMERLTSRNEHSPSVEALYLKGMALKYLGENQKAYDVFFRASWDYSYRSASYDSFAKGLQSEMAEAVADRPKKVTQELFVDHIVKDDKGNEFVITRDVASAIHFDLIVNGYINKIGELTDKYYEDKANGEIKIADEAKDFSADVIGIIDSIYDSKAMQPENARSNNVELQVDDEKLNSKEFKALWSKINAKSVYVVDFDTDELIKKSIASLDSKLRVAKIYFKVETGAMDTIKSKEDLMAGASFVKEESGSYGVRVAANSNVKYDLIGKLVDETGLTRKAIIAILQGIQPFVFDQFKDNPEEFITKAAQLINDQKATAIVEHITYDVLDEQYGTDIFTDPTIKGKLGVNAMKAKKHLYDHIVYDSINERDFATDLDTNTDVAVYVKLPDGFYISTPVGHYNPDWAIAFYEGSVKHIYFVAETKGSMNSMQLRLIEESKIHCAQEHFKAISNGNVVYDVVDSYKSLMEKVMK